MSRKMKWDQNRKAWRKSKTFVLPSGERKTFQRDFRYPKNERGYRQAIAEFESWVEEKRMELGLSHPMNEVMRAVKKWTAYQGKQMPEMGVLAAVADEEDLRGWLGGVKDGSLTVGQAYALITAVMNTKISTEIEPFISDSQPIGFEEICKRFLKLKEKMLATTSYATQKCMILQIKEWAKKQKIQCVKAQNVEEWWREVEGRQISNAHKSSLMKTFKEIVRYGAQNELLEAPKNLNSPMFRFSVSVRDIECFSVEEIRALLHRITDPIPRLHTLLALNCGMTQKEIADLTPSNIDLRKGTITRKRTKTAKHKTAPTVTYKLWDETLQLLKKHGLNTTTHKIQYEWRALKVSRGFKYLRKTGASILAGHPQFSPFIPLFLAHSPSTIAERHYVKTPQEQFDEAVGWLGDQILAKSCVTPE